MPIKGNKLLPRSISILPIIMAVGISIVKAWCLTQKMVASFDLVLFLSFIRNDLAMIGLIAFLGFATAVFRIRFLSVFCSVFAATTCMWFVLDSGVAVTLNARTPISTIIRFFLEWNNPVELAKLSVVLLVPIGAMLRFKGLATIERIGILGLVMSLSLMFLPTLQSSYPIHEYATTIFVDRENRNIVSLPAKLYSEEELQKAQAEMPRFSQAIIHPE